MRARTRASLLIGLALSLVLAAGCGSNKDDSNTKTGASEPASGVQTAKAMVKEGYAGTHRELPTSGPTPKKAQKILVIACSQAAPGCAVPAAAMAEAGKVLGWRVTVFDGKLTPSVYASGVQQAISGHYDGIILNSVDCAPIKAPLAQAKAAGIKIVSFISLDCSDPSAGGGKPLFDGQLLFKDRVEYKANVQAQVSRLIAAYTIAKTDGKAKIVELREDDTASVKYNSIGFEKWIAKLCPDCKIYKTLFTGGDLLNGALQSKTSAALAAHPDANAVMAPYDASILLGIGAAVKASGRKLILTGNEGLAPNIALIKQGLQTMAVGFPDGWGGWGAIDEMNRALNNEPSVDEGIGNQIVDKDHNLPTKTAFFDADPIDYKAAYKKIWGVK
jgi:ribose transport system substrate-binding protein